MRARSGGKGVEPSASPPSFVVLSLSLDRENDCSVLKKRKNGVKYCWCDVDVVVVWGGACYPLFETHLLPVPGSRTGAIAPHARERGGSVLVVGAPVVPDQGEGWW